MKTRWVRGLGAQVVVAFICASAPAAAMAADWTGNLNWLYGRRASDSGDWKPIHRATTYGMEATWGRQDQPLLVATDYYWFSARGKNRVDDPRVSSQAQELAIGLRKIWGAKLLRPYAGAGVSYLWYEANRLEPSGQNLFKDRTAGVWVGGGLSLRLGKHLNLGVAARYTAAKNVQLGRSLQASGGMVGATVGVGWGGAETK